MNQKPCGGRWNFLKEQFLCYEGHRNQTGTVHKGCCGIDESGVGFFEDFGKERKIRKRTEGADSKELKAGTDTRETFHFSW